MISLVIQCEEKWFNAQEEARNHYDNSLDKCVVNLMSWMHPQSQVKTIRVFADHGLHTFGFVEEREDGTQGVKGGIVFHGFPDEGYIQNGSVQLSPTYGWQIHT